MSLLPATLGLHTIPSQYNLSRVTVAHRCIQLLFLENSPATSDTHTPVSNKAEHEQIPSITKTTPLTSYHLRVYIVSAHIWPY